MSRFRNIVNATREEGPLTPEETPPVLESQERRIRTPLVVEGRILDLFVRTRDALLSATSDHRSGTYGVTSSRDQEGKTTVSICLAYSFASAGPMNVLLVDANFRHPEIHSQLGIPKDPGLADLIRGDLRPQRVMTRMEDLPLTLLPSGTSRRPPAELLSTERFGKVMEEMKTLFDAIIVDLPSVRPFPDVEIIGRYLDGAILVVEADKTQLPLIREAKTRIENASIPLLGVTMNRMQNVLPDFVNKRIGLH